MPRRADLKIVGAGTGRRVVRDEEGRATGELVAVEDHSPRLGPVVTPTPAADDDVLTEEDLTVPAMISGSPELVDLWEELVPPLAQAGKIHAGDTLHLERLVVHTAAYRDAAQELLLIGPTVRGRDGTQVKNPAEAVARAESLVVQGILKDLGVTRGGTPGRPKVRPSETGRTPAASAEGLTDPAGNPFLASALTVQGLS